MAPTHNRFETLARFGYAARGVVYFIIAMIALLAGFAGTQPSPEGALTALLQQPYGRIMLGAMAIGLAGFVLWRLCQGLFNADNRDHDAKGYLARAGKVVSAIAYTLLAITAAQLAIGNGGGGGSGQGQDGFIASVMGLPFGKILVGTVGLGVIAAGLGQMWKGISGAFKKRLQLPSRYEKPLGLVGTYGIAARAIVFIILGGFVLYAAITVDPERAGSLPEALDWIRGLPFGGVLYTGMSLGLLAFAAYCVVQALYRRVDPPTAQEIKRAVPGM